MEGCLQPGYWSSCKSIYIQNLHHFNDSYKPLAVLSLDLHRSIPKKPVTVPLKTNITYVPHAITIFIRITSETFQSFHLFCS